MFDSRSMKDGYHTPDVAKKRPLGKQGEPNGAKGGHIGGLVNNPRSQTAARRKDAERRAAGGAKQNAGGSKRGGIRGKGGGGGKKTAGGGGERQGEEEEMAAHEELREGWDRDNPKRGPGKDLANDGPMDTGLTELPESLKKVLELSQEWLPGATAAAARAYVAFEVERFALRYDVIALEKRDLIKEIAPQPSEGNAESVMTAAAVRLVKAVEKRLKDKDKKTGELPTDVNGVSGTDAFEGEEGHSDSDNYFEEYIEDDRLNLEVGGRLETAKSARVYEYTATLSRRNHTWKLVLDIPKKADACRAYRAFGAHSFFKVKLPRNIGGPRYDGAVLGKNERKEAEQEQENRRWYQRAVERLVEKGVKLFGGSRQFLLIPSGESHLKTRTLTFLCVHEYGAMAAHGMTAAKFLAWFCSEPLPESMPVAKYSARFGLLFSRTLPTILAREQQVREDHDVKYKDAEGHVWCASDGCSAMSIECMKGIQEKLGLDYMPSWVQFRWSGCKGVLYLDKGFHSQPGSEGKLFAIRPSQRKLPTNTGELATDHHLTLEVNSWSPHPSRALKHAARLNQQIIGILREMGVPDDVFEGMLEQDLAQMKPFQHDDQHDETAKAREFLQKREEYNKDARLCSDMLKDGAYDLKEIFVRHTIKSMLDSTLKKLKKKTAIECTDSRHLVGIADPTDTLAWNQVFVRLGGVMDYREASEQDGPNRGMSHKWLTLEEGRNIVVGRNPCQHPGDVRVFQTTSNPELERRIGFNLIVFSTQPDPSTGQSVADKMSGGDFDGDLYLVIWDKQIVSPILEKERYKSLAPHMYGKMVKSDSKEVTSTQIKADDIDERLNKVKKYLLFMLTEFQDNLGKITNLHKALMDEADPENFEVIARMIKHDKEMSCTPKPEMRTSPQQQELFNQLCKQHELDPEGKGLCSERVKELAILAAEAVDTTKVGKTVEVPHWAKDKAVLVPNWMKDVKQGGNHSTGFESKSLYARLWEIVDEHQQELSKSVSHFERDFAHKQYRDITQKCTAQSDKASCRCMRYLPETDAIREQAKRIVDTVRTRIASITATKQRQRRYYNANDNEEMREAYRWGEMKWAEEAADLTHLEKMTLAWAVYDKCYKDCTSFDGYERITIVRIPWKLTECHQILRSLRAEVVRHRNPEKVMTRTELVPREDKQDAE